MTTSLLPSNRTPWELALSETSGARRPLPTRMVTSLWNPDTCPVDLLGWMAEQFSVDVWDESWPETLKREVCRNAFKLHRLKTTPAGIKQHVALTGATVKRIVRPPATGFLYAAMTDAQRQAWLDSLAQIRIYPFFRRSIAKSRHFASGPGGRQFHSSRNYGTRTLTDTDGSPVLDGAGNPITFVNSVAAVETSDDPSDDAAIFITGFTRKSRGRDLYGKRATIYDAGVEQEVVYEASEGEAVQRVYIRARRKRSWHRAGLHSRPFLTPTTAARNVVTLRLNNGAGQFAVGAGMTPIDVRPQRVMQPRVAPSARSFFGRHRAGRFLKSTFAPLLIYDRISLHDADRLGARRKTRQFHGHGRFGIPAYTAELRINVPMLRSRARSGLWHKAGYRKAPDMLPLQRAIEAVRASKAFRDTVLIDTATYGQVKFAGGMRFGDFAFGEIKEVA